MRDLFLIGGGTLVGLVAGWLLAKWRERVMWREHNREINRTARLVANWNQPRTFRRCRLYEEDDCDATLPFQEDPEQSDWSYVASRGGWLCPDHTEEHNAAGRTKEEE